MRLFLVEHSYGAALVHARNKEQAAEIGDALGDVMGVHDFDVPMAFDIERVERTNDDGDQVSDLQIQATHGWDFQEDVEQLLASCEVALDAPEYAQMHPPETPVETGEFGPWGNWSFVRDKAPELGPLGSMFLMHREMGHASYWIPVFDLKTQEDAEPWLEFVVSDPRFSPADGADFARAVADMIRYQESLS